MFCTCNFLPQQQNQTATAAVQPPAAASPGVDVFTPGQPLDDEIATIQPVTLEGDGIIKGADLTATVQVGVGFWLAMVVACRL